MNPSTFSSKFNFSIGGGFFAASFAILALLPFIASAQAVRSYEYSGIGITYTVNTDSTVDVHETQSYKFTGAYHEAERILPHKGSDAITDFTVTDTTSGVNLVYAGTTELDKTNPNSWGKYTVRNTGDTTVIDWYYNLADTTHSWVLTYKLHGAISFYKDHDELYWNLFDSYTVPVQQVEVIVVLPAADTLPTSKLYVNGEHHVQLERYDDKTFAYTASQFAPHEAVTVAVGWQKGLVSEAAYRSEVYSATWPYIVAGLIVLGSILFCLLYGYFANRIPRTIVAEYEPPEALPPAEAEVVMRGHLTKRAWPATIIDLAVRGYLKIEDDPQPGWMKAVYIVGHALLWIVFIAVFWIFNRTDLKNIGDLFGSLWITVFIGAIFFVYLGRYFNFRSWIPKDYILRENKDADKTALKEYERQFLTTLFGGSIEDPGTFSTKKLRRSSTSQRSMYLSMEELKQVVYQGTDTDTHAYDHALAKRARGLSILILVCVVVFAAGIFVPSYFGMSFFSPFIVLGIGVVLCVAIIVYVVRFASHLSKDGRMLRADWLGFKLYLETADKYRLQNLTPETFEKYLPYAIIFGVEKKWARAFDTLNLQPPTWYGGAYATGGFAGGTSSFSPSSFATSFSASFATSFMSSGGGGGFSGGGGGAGGGGGGGGGGAS